MKSVSVLVFALASLCFGQPADLVAVASRPLERTVKLPGEFAPYEQVDLHAKVSGYVDKVLVDRGSVVKEGDLLVTMSAPEVKAQVAEADAKVKAIEAQMAEARARILAAQSTYDRLKQASSTPGAIAGNELVIARETVEAAKAALMAQEGARDAARASADTLRELQKYLDIRAPFSGVITERLVHPGALAAAGTGAAAPLLRLERLSSLRLTVAVPESAVGGSLPRGQVEFQVPAFPGRSFRGTIARAARTLDPNTRTMPVEIDVQNSNGLLAPGMYPEVLWPARGLGASLLVPPASIVTTTERTFVIRSTQGKAEWVTIRRGAAAGDLVEVYGPLKPGDRILKRATDEIREGTKLP
ncbi:MAG TPA: efflux RND transporter periplasmic adaptor subunit [Bryobacteraceae bacterium]|nr:efflux RND transporter periplasmic adaptor subunit [Bryobacteraceae bacterium]